MKEQKSSHVVVLLCGEEQVGKTKIAQDMAAFAKKSQISTSVFHLEHLISLFAPPNASDEDVNRNLGLFGFDMPNVIFPKDPRKRGWMIYDHLTKINGITPQLERFLDSEKDPKKLLIIDSIWKGKELHQLLIKIDRMGYASRVIRINGKTPLKDGRRPDFNYGHVMLYNTSELYKFISTLFGG